MRDYGRVWGLSPIRRDHTDSMSNPGCGSLPEIKIYQDAWYFRSLKGRQESVSGPKPFPTPYYAFRANTKSTYKVDRGEGWAYRWDGCGWHYQYTEVSQLPPLGPANLLSNWVFYTQRFSDTEVYDFLLPSVSVETRSRARLSAINKLRSSKVNLGQTVGELPFALRELTKLLIGVGRVLLELKKGNVLAANRHLRPLLGGRGLNNLTKNAASAALTWKFGVAPVLNDIEHLVGEIGKAMERPDLIRVKGTATRTFSPNDIGGWTTGGSLLEVAQVGYLVRPKPHYSAAFLGLTNPIGLAWELFPLSFVINWFISIGDVLTSLDANIGLDVISGYETLVLKGTTEYTQSGSVRDGGYVTTAFAMQRFVLSAIAMPGLYAKSTIGSGQIKTLGLIMRAMS